MDDSRVRRIWLQFASRLGKTFFGQCCVAKKADCSPGDMIFASATEKVAVEIVERLYKTLEQTPMLCNQLRPVSRRRQACVDFDACKCHVAWSRSVSTLADKEAELGHGNEIDKWEQLATSREADPMRLFLDRFKNRPLHKVILESTPTVKGKSRIETGRLSSTNCQFYVPCPHCGRYQTLKMRSGSGGSEKYHLIWDRLDGGKQDKDLARRTAWYECEHCQGKIDDFHRPGMMRLGVWCPEGCRVNDTEAREVAQAYLNASRPRGRDGAMAPMLEWNGWSSATWIEGAPLRDGPDAGYQLSSLYALSLTWGDMAAEFVSCKDKPQDLRNFINGWLAETWEHARRQSTWEVLGQRIIDDGMIRGRAPAWASMITVGLDRQSAGGARFPWVVDAWGPGKCATIAYGEAETFEDLLANVLQVQWPHEDGGPSLSLSCALIDSGHRPDGVYDFCKSGHLKQINIWPCKGSSQAMDSDYRISVLGENTSCPGMRLVLVDTIRTQLWIDSQIDNPDGVYAIHHGSLLEHQDFLEQITNDAAVDDLDRFNNVRQSWERINTGVPNDFRDCRRYAYVAMLIATAGRGISARSGHSQERRPAVISAGTERQRPRW